MLTVRVLLALSFLLASAPARAGVVDSPIPVIPTVGKLKHVYTVTGVSDGGDLGTAFICTNLDRQNVFIAVEIFASGGGGPLNDVTADVGTVLPSPGQTSTIELQQILSFFEDELMDMLPQVKHGSARILATSTKILCTAALVEKFTEPAVSMMKLPVIRKTKQQGD
jgi:hypothetical protein